MKTEIGEATFCSLKSTRRSAAISREVIRQYKRFVSVTYRRNCYKNSILKNLNDDNQRKNDAVENT